MSEEKIKYKRNKGKQLKGFFQKTGAGRIIRSVGLGLLDGIKIPILGPVNGIIGGVVSEAKKTHEANVSDEVTVSGKTDYTRYISAIVLGAIVVYGFYSLLTGEMSLNDLINLFGDIGIIE